MKFSDVLASVIHDMKNSLGIVINTIDELVAENDSRESGKLSMLQHEAKRLNNNLIALLSLYKMENGRLDANIEEVYVGDFLEEVVLDNQTLAEAKNVDLDYLCDEGLVGYFDEWLIRGVINNLIGNALRYTTSRISIHAGIEESCLVFRIEDDGQGFPQSMIDAQAAFNRNNALNEDNTQLGIYFASMVAQMHKNGNRSGCIELSNAHRLKGGCFAIRLP